MSKPLLTLCLLALAALATSPAHAVTTEAGRIVKPLMRDWRFHYTGQPGNAQALSSPRFDDSRWSEVSLPHTWNHFGTYTTHRTADVNLKQGVGWYRLHVSGASLPVAARWYLQFGAVGNVADVWVNGQHVGHHAGAFSRFRIDVTGLLKRHGDNVIAVRADNSAPATGSTTRDVIPLSGDFFIHGGLYRGVALIGVGEQHIDLLDFGGPGVYVHTLHLDAARAAVRIRTRLRNDAAEPHAVTLILKIHDARGRTVAERQRAFELPAATTLSRSIDVTVPHPHRWDGRRDPYLYHVTATLESHGHDLDRVIQPLGLRSMRITADRGFFLNGRHLPLHGVSRHQDRLGVGWAVTRADEDQDMALIREIGANTIRMAHYEQSPHWFDLADRNGMVVWAEAPLVNAVSLGNAPASPALIANARQQLTELIVQNMNHPSVAVWGIGNETDLMMSFGKLGARADPSPLLKNLDALAHRLDPSRPTTLADCCESTPGSASRHLPMLAGLADAIGYNRYFGWYYGKVGDLGPHLDALHARHPHLPIAVSEFGAGGAISQHTDNPLGGPIDTEGRPHPEEFQSWWHEHAWPQLAKRPYIWAAWVWNMFDFSSPIRHSGDSTDINDKGLVTFDRKTRKDAFYYYKAQWSSQPTVHINGRRYIHRAYAVTDIRIYANAPFVEVSLNGRSLGRIACPNRVCVMRQVHLTPGENTIRASARFNGRVVSDRVRWQAPDARRGLGINVGDLAGFVSAKGFRNGSDNWFRGGTPHRLSPRRAARVRGAGEPPMYPGYREGRFSYAIPLPDGSWQVSLLFIDPRRKVSTPWVFDVRADSRTVLRSFDPARVAGGSLRAISRRFTVTTHDGLLRLDFVPRSGHAVLSGIRIRPVNGARHHARGRDD